MKYHNVSTHLATGCNGASRVTAGVQRVLALVMLSLVGGSQNTRSNVSPGTVVEGLLLAPKKIGIRVLVKMRRYLQIDCQSQNSHESIKQTHEVVREW